MNDSSSKYLITLICMSMGILLLLSAVPWSTLTGNTIKDFNLFEDLLPRTKNEPLLDVVSADPDMAFLDDDLDGADGTGGGSAGTAAPADTLRCDSAAVDSVPMIIPVYHEAPRHDGMVVIENYTDGPLLPRFSEAVANAANRTVRVAVVGDSYIEGDIFVQDLRAALQQRWGGCGIGFSPSHSEFPGFRQSMHLSSSGWKLHDIRTMSRRDSLRQLSSDHCKAEGAATSTFKGSKRLPGADRWERSTFVFIAPAGGTITLSGDDGLTAQIEAEATSAPQAAVLEGSTTSLKVHTEAPGIIALGTLLDGATGVQVDCMSVRGNSGMPLGRLNASLCSALRQWADYDLIVMEFGMNAISQGQTNYNAYGKNMARAVEAVKRAYPLADVLIMGVGDRAGKASGTLESMPECTGMVNAQRQLAADTRSFFWDTRAAMGGEGAAIEWRKNRHLNADYIHLNHDGGAELARLFDYALSHAVD